jgi:quercetin dioxygenase-like cupin family protein
MFFPGREQPQYKQDENPQEVCGTRWLEDLQGAPSSPLMRPLYVKFEDGAYTKWHYHTGEQLLLVAEGKGFVEFEGGPPIEIQPNDRVYIPAEQWHRHGALAGETLVHLAVTIGRTEWRYDDPCDRHS